MKKASPIRNLEIDNPILAKDWHPKKNGKLAPRDFLKSSNKKVWWKCSKGHEWQAMIFAMGTLYIIYQTTPTPFQI